MNKSMPEHSQAKVELYTTYLSTFLRIISKTKFIDTLHIYDLLCGEGVYEDGSDGSPIAALKKIKEHYFSNDKKCPNIFIWFNDLGMSQIEPSKLKIDRVRELRDGIFLPKNVSVRYSNQDIIEILPEVKQKADNIKKNERLLLFIDPYGYKNLGPLELRNILSNKYVELIFFVPASHIHRFARKAIEDSNFRGGEAARKFLFPLLNHGLNVDNFTTVNRFIDETKNALREFFKNDSVFVDTYTIERNRNNTYCIFFFTHHVRGFEKMLATKWTLDENRGVGFKLNSGQHSLFNNDFELYMSEEYSKLLEEEIKNANKFTNSDIYLFGLEHGFLPKHSSQIIRDWQRNRPDFKILKEDGKTETKYAYIKYENYIESPSRKKVEVTYKFE